MKDPPPALRFDAAGKADSIEAIVDAASRRVLSPEERRTLKEAFRNHEPWLEWTGKREQQGCVADPVALHIHERISAQAILKVAAWFLDSDYDGRCFCVCQAFFPDRCAWEKLGKALRFDSPTAGRQAIAVREKRSRYGARRKATRKSQTT